jgi:hypothetical protein
MVIKFGDGDFESERSSDKESSCSREVAGSHTGGDVSGTDRVGL